MTCTPVWLAAVLVAVVLMLAGVLMGARWIMQREMAAHARLHDQIDELWAHTIEWVEGRLDWMDARLSQRDEP